MITALPVNHMVGLHSTVSDCMFPTYQQIHALDHKKKLASSTFAGTGNFLPGKHPENLSLPSSWLDLFCES
ncbi:MULTISPECIES: hypothetical protein [unclassified Akkermansia]|nr:MULTISPECIES: hypothetical protein [unclassified Akkermansia]